MASAVHPPMNRFVLSGLPVANSTPSPTVMARSVCEHGARRVYAITIRWVARDRPEDSMESPAGLSVSNSGCLCR